MDEFHRKLGALRKQLVPVRCRPVAGWVGYAVTDDGRVFSCRRYRDTFGPWRQLQPIIDKDGYRRVRLKVCGRVRGVYVHVLVLEAFVGPKPAGTFGLHRDDDPANNGRRNLRWGTLAQNAVDRRRNRGYGEGVPKNVGESNGQAKLSDVQVELVRRRRAAGSSRKEVADEFGVSVPYVSKLTKGKSRRPLKLPA